jgi:hypothetical protein
MTTKVQLFLSMKNESNARPLGLRRLRRAPGRGQRFAVAIDGRSVCARITGFSTPLLGTLPPDVYAEEV